ncbi:MAG TPA: hypothetical protein VE574_05155 [Nitrososphaeraceae archaeon]|nr:hypothetical protein [Nitrososphaeraceae archaeon]
MKRLTIRHAMIFASLATILMVTIIFTQSYPVTAFPQQYRGENQIFGVISSLQNDESGQPAWIVTGPWTTTLLSDSSANASQPMGNATGPFGGSPFNTQVQMVRLDGTAGHTHTITNFVLANVSQPNNMTKVFNGTSTASMREGPVTDIPTTIRIMGDKVISIWLDPSRIENHYGNTPLYGLVMDVERPRPGPMGMPGE